MKVSSRFVVITVLFVTTLITANVIGVKLISIDSVILPAAIIVFPLSYIFGDILTEVYGYGMTRRVIWIGFICNLIFVLFTWIGGILPAAPLWSGQEAYEVILGYVPRILLASFLGYLVGEFANSFVLARLKLFTKGRFLWFRTIGSTVIGQGLDSTVFITVAFIGTTGFASELIVWHWLTKVGIEAFATPITYRVVNYLKRCDRIDTYDYKTDYNPFVLND
jgi:uncharacterized integral membrane protein (TIGR00697 family)